MEKDKSWITKGFRKCVGDKIQYVINSLDMENIYNGLIVENMIFQRTKSTVEYLSSVDKTIKEIHKKKHKLRTGVKVDFFHKIPSTSKTRTQTNLASNTSCKKTIISANEATLNLQPQVSIEIMKEPNINGNNDYPLKNECSERKAEILNDFENNNQEEASGLIPHVDRNSRKIMVLKIEEAVCEAGLNPKKSSVEMEKLIFLNAKNNSDYQLYVFRLITFAREIAKQKTQEAGPLENNNPVLTTDNK